MIWLKKFLPLKSIWDLNESLGSLVPRLSSGFGIRLYNKQKGLSPLATWGQANKLSHVCSSGSISLLFYFYSYSPVLLLTSPSFFSSSLKALLHRSLETIKKLQELPLIGQKHISRVNYMNPSHLPWQHKGQRLQEWDWPESWAQSPVR